MKVCLQNLRVINDDRIEEEDCVVLCDGEAVDVGELGGGQCGNDIRGLEGALWPVPHHLHPGIPRQALLEAEVDRVVRPDFPHPVRTAARSQGINGRRLLAQSGEVRYVEPGGVLPVSHRQVYPVFLGPNPPEGGVTVAVLSPPQGLVENHQLLPPCPVLLLSPEGAEGDHGHQLPRLHTGHVVRRLQHGSTEQDLAP